MIGLIIAKDSMSSSAAPDLDEVLAYSARIAHYLGTDTYLYRGFGTLRCLCYTSRAPGFDPLNVGECDLRPYAPTTTSAMQ